MKMLDRYIVRNFLYAALLWFVVFMALRTVGDLFVNIDEFSEKMVETRVVQVDGRSVTREIERDPTFGEVSRQIGTYYGYQSFVFFTELGGVIIVAAAAFSLARMNESNELTAMLASGVSLYRVVWPIVLCSMLLGGLIILDQELIIPRIAEHLVRSRDEMPGTEEFSVDLMTDSKNTVWYSRRFRQAQNVMEEPSVLVRDADYETLVGIFGDEARPADFAGRRGWMFSGAEIAPVQRLATPWELVPNHRRIGASVDVGDLIVAAIEAARTDGQSLPPGTPVTAAGPVPPVTDERYGLTISAERLVLDSEWKIGSRPLPSAGTLINPRFEFASARDQHLGTFLADSASFQPADGRGDGVWRLTDGVLFYRSDLDASEMVLRQDSKWMEYMSIARLSQLIRMERVSDRKTAELTKHVRITEPLNNLVMLLVGLPFILSRERNIKASASLCLLTVGTFYVFVYVCRYMELAPMLAAWLPILLFGPIAAVMLDSVKT